MRRIACIALPQIRVEIAQEREGRTGRRKDGKGWGGGADARQSLPASPPSCDLSLRSTPLAIVVARPGGSVQTERDVLGNTRVDVVSREARAMGVRSGQTVAAARAKCAELRVRVVAEGAVEEALARIAEAALAVGPASGFDAAQDVVWVDVGGCAHLHGGEGELARALDASVRALGYACRVAVADGPRIAAAVARFAPWRRRGPLVVGPGKGAAAMRALPIAALALDEDVTAWLADLGLTTCGDLQKLPRRSLGTRLGVRAHDVMQLLDGDDRAPLDAWRPPEVPEERLELEWGAHSIEALAFVLKTLCDRLAARLTGRAMSAARLELTLSLDRALCGDAPAHVSLDITLPAPVGRAADLLAVVRARLERLSGADASAAGRAALAAPVLAVTLRAPELARSASRTLDLLSPEPKADRALPRLAAELTAELGPSRVGTLALIDTWVPDERTRLVPYGAPYPSQPHQVLTTSCLEPTRLVASVPIARDAIVASTQLLRIEAVQWWRREAIERRDVVAAWIGSAKGVARGGAHGWVELRGDADALLRGWID